MPSWSHLPVEIKQHVAKKLDFMSRHSLKSTSHRDRQIMNSTTFHIPRVRFGYKESKCLIVIYTGIEKFLRLELSECNSGIMIDRSENSWDPKDISTKILPSDDPLKLGVFILKSLLCHKSIIMKAMEWDVTNEDGKANNQILMQRLLNYLDGSKFRANELVYIWNNYDDVKKPVEEVCFMDDLVKLRAIGMLVSSRNLVPVVTYDYIECNEQYGGKPMYISELSMEFTAENYLRISSVCAGVLSRNPGAMQVATFRDTTKKIRANRPEFHTSHNTDDCVTMAHLNECGHWTHRIIKEVKNEVLDFYGLKSEKCGLDYLCKRCADPFEYWYYQNLPRRLLHEPFWDSIILTTLQTEQELARETRVLKLKLARDEKEKGRIQKGKKIQKTSASWGFRKAPIQNIVCDNKKNQEKKNKKKMKKLIKKGVILKDSDEVKNSESPKVEENEKDVRTSESPEVVEKERDMELPENVILKGYSNDNSEKVEDSEDCEYLTASENEEEVEVGNVMDSSKSGKPYQFLKLFISMILGPIFLTIIYYFIIYQFNY